LIVTATRPILHVLNGDATRVILEDTDVPGDIAVWADVLYEGPCPAGLTQAEWRSVRARHHAPGGEDGEDGGAGEGENVALLRDWNERLDRFDEYGEVVFWLEHDLFDQLLLIRHLHWLSSAVADRSRARLICIDRFRDARGSWSGWLPAGRRSSPTTGGSVRTPRRPARSR
jgi:hypothetical protein